MARILCSISGLEYKAQYFPYYACANESHHPVFDIPAHKLPGIYETSYLSGTLSSEENYLLYLALFRSTGMVDFRLAATRTDKTPGIIANSIHSLVQMQTRISEIGANRMAEVLLLPRFIITVETRDLTPCPDWLRTWQDNYADYRQGYRTSTALEKLTRIEESLERSIKSKLKDVSSYAAQLANWAEQAGSFPTVTALDENNIPIPLSEYWKRIIKFCAKGELIYSIPDDDLDKLTTYCEETIAHGNIQAATLMALLRSARDKKGTLATLGDIDLTRTFKILKPGDGVEEANMLALILSAPKELPLEKAYPNKLAYVRAKLKYQQAQEYYKEHPSEHPDYTPPPEPTNRREGDPA